jgi:hypothetical protein
MFYVCSGSGGAIYTECNDVDEYCTALVKSQIGLPSPMFSFRAMELINNSALAYGNDIATSPFEIVALGSTSMSLVPMINPVNASLLLKDRFGQIVKGTKEISIPYILESWTCPSTLCNIQHSLNPLAFLSFDPETGIADATASNLMVPCSGNSSTATIYFTVYRSTSSFLTKSFRMLCLGCDASQTRVNDVTTNNIPIWFCRPCRPGQYIINPNEGTCQDCPAG